MKEPSHPVIFLVKNRALGDSIMGLSTVSYLKKIYPKSTIIYAIPQWTTSLYEEVVTDADLIYPLKLKGTSDILKLYRDLRKLKVDFIHEMHQSGTGKKVFGLYSFFTGIKYTAHNHHLEGNTKVIDQGVKKALIQRDLDGAHSFLGNGDIPSYLEFPPKMTVKEVKSTQKVNRIILGVVATRDSKKWPLSNFLELAKNFLLTHPDFEFAIPLSNSSEDLKIKLEIEKNCTDKRVKVICKKLSDLPQYFSESVFYIGNDTGLKHLAVSVGLKTLTMFGPEPILEWHPYDLKKHHAFYIESLSCRTRTSHYCGLFKCDLGENENMQCLKGITVDQVMFFLTNSICARTV